MNQDPAKVEGILQGMMKKGLVFPRYPKKEESPCSMRRHRSSRHL